MVILNPLGSMSAIPGLLLPFHFDNYHSVKIKKQKSLKMQCRHLFYIFLNYPLIDLYKMFYFMCKMFIYCTYLVYMILNSFKT